VNRADRFNDATSDDRFVDERDQSLGNGDTTTGRRGLDRARDRLNRNSSRIEDRTGRDNRGLDNALDRIDDNRSRLTSDPLDDRRSARFNDSSVDNNQGTRVDVGHDVVPDSRTRTTDRRSPQSLNRNDSTDDEMSDQNFNWPIDPRVDPRLRDRVRPRNDNLPDRPPVSNNGQPFDPRPFIRGQGASRTGMTDNARSTTGTNSNTSGLDRAADRIERNRTRFSDRTDRSNRGLDNAADRMETNRQRSIDRTEPDPTRSTAR